MVRPESGARVTIYTRVQRSTGVLTTVGTAEELGCDPDGGKWVVLCEEHSTLVNVDTRKIARAVDVRDFCEACYAAWEARQPDPSF
jgi:hypothetical protein